MRSSTTTTITTTNTALNYVTGKIRIVFSYEVSIIMLMRFSQKCVATRSRITELNGCYDKKKSHILFRLYIDCLWQMHFAMKNVTMCSGTYLLSCQHFASIAKPSCIYVHPIFLHRLFLFFSSFEAFT